METNNNHYKWTKGEPYEKSSKTQKKELSTLTSISETKEINEFKSIHYITPDGFTRKSNKRALTNKKMSERKLIAQVSINPYIGKQNYINALTSEDKFLRPKSSNSNL